jgi:tetratricopeptide (TPR) repeat protein
LIGTSRTRATARRVIASALALLALAPAVGAPIPTVSAPAAAAGAESFPATEILAIDESVRGALDDRLGSVRSPLQLAVELHEFLFTPEGLNIVYAAGATRTAQETFDERSGNCLSLANLYVASARYLGLDARFQKVEVPPSWQESHGFYILPGHVNVGVRVNPRARAVVEFVATAVSTSLRDREISDDQAFAEYFSNLGVESLERGDMTSAVELLERATRVDPSLGWAWSNLGVARKASGDMDGAEAAYHRALEIEPRNLSALHNLHALYSDLGESEAAARLAQRVERYAQQNPYLLARRAGEAYQRGDHEEAVRLLKRAIRKKDDEPRFYHWLARSYVRLGKLQRAEKALERAAILARSESEELRYAAKLDAIARLMELE